MEWKDGYLIDSEYTYTFWPLCSPTRLAFTAVMNGVAPPPLDRFRYLELGCGHGFQPALLAAANPQAEFVGVDFNPAHIDSGNALKRAARLDNLSYICASFEDLVDDPPAGLGRFDFIVLHGVFAWISDEARASLCRLLRQVAAPGALVNLSYNALPAWSEATALQRFLVNYGIRNPGRSEDQVQAGLDLARRLKTAPKSFFNSPAIAARIDETKARRPAYLAHEYMNRESRAFYFYEIDQTLSAQGFRFAGSCDLERAFPAIAYPPELLADLPGSEDPAWRETVADYVSNTWFRSDLFCLDAARLSDAERTERLDAMPLVAQAPSEAWPDAIASSLGQIVLPTPVMSAAKAAFASGATDGRSLREALGPEVDATPVIAFLAWLNVVRPGLPVAVDREPARRFNRMVAGERPFGHRFADMASPTTGSGVSVFHVTALALETRQAGRLEERIAAAEALLAERGEALLADGRRLADPMAQRQELAKWFVAYDMRYARMIEALGVEI